MKRTRTQKNLKKPLNPASATTKPFIQHLEELRNRLFQMLIILLIFSGVGYFLHTYVLYYLVKPLGQTIYYSTPGGGFDLVFKVSLLFGFLLTLPFLIYHTLAFLQPAFPKLTKDKIITIIFFSFLLMSLGVVLGYFLSLPAALYFLNSFGTPEVQALISSQDYLSFIMLYLGGFGLLFQLPLILLVINSFKRLSIKRMVNYLRIVIVGSFIIAAILTPTPDLFNQTIMALPIILLYVLSIGLIWIINKHAKPINTI